MQCPVETRMKHYVIRTKCFLQFQLPFVSEQKTEIQVLILKLYLHQKKAEKSETYVRKPFRDISMSPVSPVRGGLLRSDDVCILNVFTQLWEQKVIDNWRNGLHLTHVPSPNKDPHFPLRKEPFQGVGSEERTRGRHAPNQETPAATKVTGNKDNR